MNKRIWSIAIALAMLLSMVCSAFVVSAAETQAAVQIEEDQIEEQVITEEIELSQQALLLAADGSSATSLKLTPSTSNIVAGEEFTVDLSLDNYTNENNNGWASFTVDLTYDAAAVEYQGYELKKASGLTMVTVEEGDAGTLTIIVLNSENISAEIAADLLTLKFKATAASAAPISASFVEDSLGRYLADGTSDYVTAGDAVGNYSAAAVSPQISIEKKTPYLTIRLVDAEGNEISGGNIEQGKELYAIVTLNDYYDPWMSMTLSLNYDSSLFTYVETEGEDLDAFVSDENGKMTVIPAETEDEDAPLSICFMSSDLSNRLLKDDENGNAVTTADVLKLKFVVNSDAEGELKLGTSFVEGGNLKTDEAGSVTELTPAVDYEVQDEEKGTASVTIETIDRPYLTLNVVDGEGNLNVDLKNMKVEKGDSFTVQVKINNFTQKWSMMSLFARFDSDVFEIPNGADGAVKGEFGDEMVPYLVDNILGVTMFNMNGADTGLTSGNPEGVVLEIPLTVKENADFSGGIDPFQVFFDTEGNYSGGDLVSNEYYDSQEGDPAEIVMKAQGQPQVKMVVVEDPDVDLNNLKAGDQVQFKVSVDNFIGAWSTMTLQLKYNSDVFDLVDGSVVNSEPFDTTNGGTSVFRSSADGGYLLACWFNSKDLPMTDKSSQEVMTFTLKVKDGYTVAANELTQYISVKFDEEGNYADGNLLVGSETVGMGDYISTPVEILVTVVEPEAPVIMVAITWGEAIFTYDLGTWDPGTHTWKDCGWKWESTDGSKTNCLTVTNEGTAEITAVFTFEGSTGISGNFYEDEACSSLKTEVTVSGSESINVYFMPEGELTETVEAGETVSIGTIKVAIE